MNIRRDFCHFTYGSYPSDEHVDIKEDPIPPVISNAQHASDECRRCEYGKTNPKSIFACTAYMGQERNRFRMGDCWRRFVANKEL